MRYLVAGLVAGLMGAGAAQAATNLVMNGDFEQFVTPSGTPGASYQVKTVGNGNNPNGGTITSWSNNGYTFLYNAGTADTTGAVNSEYGGVLKLWGPNDGSANGLTPTSPVGGNFVASDGAFQPGPISQSIAGLSVGTRYDLSFWWAAAQQLNYSGETTDSWGVTFGGQTYTTDTVTLANHAFSPWKQAFFSFVATSATQTLAFLAAGSPSGAPPFALLDGIVLVAAPEPSTFAIMGAGLVASMLVLRRRRTGPSQSA